jgi:hypothetical protein
LRLSSDTLQATVEPIGGKITESCEWVWKGASKALRQQKPRLTRMDLVDDTSKREFMSARSVTLRSEMLRRETWAPLLILILLAGYYTAGYLTFAKSDGMRFFTGAVPPLAAAAVAVLLAVRETRKGDLRWE